MIRTPKIIKLDTEKRTFYDISFVKNDTAIVEFEYYTNGIEITTFDEAHIIIKNANGIVGMLVIDCNNNCYEFGQEITEAIQHECLVVLKKGIERVTTTSFKVNFTPEWIASVVDKKLNVDVITDIYSRLNLNLDYIMQLFDITDTHTNDIQALQQDLTNKLDKHTLVKQIVSSEVEFNDIVRILKDLYIQGNIFQEGEFYKTHVQELFTEKNLIKLRDKAIQSMQVGEYAGLVALLYDGVKNGYLVFDKDGIAWVGDEGDLQPLATREINPLAQGIATWNNETNRYEAISPNTLQNRFTSILSDLVLSSTNTLNLQRDSIADVKTLVGNTQAIPTQAELTIASYQVNSSIKNEITYTNGQPYMSEKVKEVKLWEFTPNLDGTLTNTYRFGYGNFFTINNFKGTTSLNSLINTINFLQDYNSDTRHYYGSISLYLFVEKPLIDEITFANMTTQEKLVFPTFVTTLTIPQKCVLYLYRNNIKGTFELAVQNPKEKLIVDGDINSIYTGFINIDLVFISKPFDFIGYSNQNQYTISFESYTQKLTNISDTLSDLNYFSTSNQPLYYVLAVAKGTILQQAKDTLRNKKLTYQLTTPRLALSTLQSFKNPKIKCLQNNSQLSFNDTFRGLSTVTDTLLITNNLYQKSEKLKEVNLWEYTNILLLSTNSNTYAFVFQLFNVNYLLKINSNNSSNGFINMFIYENSSNDTRHWRPGSSGVDTVLWLEKPLIDQITTMTSQEQTILGFTTPDTLVKKLRVYLYRNTIQGVFEKATYEIKDLSYRGSLELVKNGTVTVESDGIINPITITYAENDKGQNELLKRQSYRQQIMIDKLLTLANL